MQLVTVGSKYQIVIPKEIRKDIKGLKPGSKLTVSRVDKDSLTIRLDPKDWIEENYGSMAQAWKDIDPIADIEKMKDEWEERLDEQAKIWNSGKIKNAPPK